MTTVVLSLVREMDVLASSIHITHHTSSIHITHHPVYTQAVTKAADKGCQALFMSLDEI